MAKRMIFSNDKVQAIFDNGECSFEAFSDLMKDVAAGKVIRNSQNEEVSKEDANKAIRKVMYSILGVDENTNRKELRRAIRRHKTDIFEVIEDTVENMIVTGWGDNPFFNQFVEIKSAAEGETNEFYTQDNVILTVSELSGNHHNLFRQRLGEGKSFNVKTSWYGVRF